MLEFDETCLANLFFSGYRWVIVINRGDHLVLKPLKNEAPEELISAMRFEQLQLLEEGVIAMAKGVYPSFIAEDFFEPHYKDYVTA
jgi:hypothetical protein